MTVLVAPRRVHDPADPALSEVPRHHPVEQPFRIHPRDLVLEQWRHVDQRGRVAHRPVLVVRLRLVVQGAGVTRPVPPGVAFAQRLGTAMKRCPERLQQSHAVAADRTLGAAVAALRQPEVALRIRIAADQPLRFQHTEQPVRRRGMESVRRGQVRQPVLRLFRGKRPIERQRPLNGLCSLRSPARHERMISHGGTRTDPDNRCNHRALRRPGRLPVYRPQRWCRRA